MKQYPSPGNHNHFLTKCRWASAVDHVQFKSFQTDNVRYCFDQVLTEDQQSEFLDFLGDSDHMNQLSILDFCTYFIHKDIPFHLQFHYSKNKPFKQNITMLYLIISLKKYIHHKEKWIEYEDELRACMNNEIREIHIDNHTIVCKKSLNDTDTTNIQAIFAKSKNLTTMLEICNYLYLRQIPFHLQWKPNKQQSLIKNFRQWKLHKKLNQIIPNNWPEFWQKYKEN